MTTVHLLDGRQVDSTSEAWRHECEARHVADLPSRQARRDYIDRLRPKQPTRAAALEATVIEIFKARRNAAQPERTPQ